MQEYSVNDYFRPNKKYVKYLNQYHEAIDNDDEEQEEKFRDKLAEMIGIIYTTKTKKIEGQEVEIPFTDFDSCQFVDFLHQSFKVISLSDNIAMYNYKEHHYDFLSASVYLSFFKEILDEIDIRVWGMQREKEYEKRFIRCIPKRFGNWQIPEGKIVFTNGILDIDTDVFFEGDNPDIINFHCVGYEYLVGATEIECPKFMKFLNSIFDEQALIDVVQEKFGATLLYGKNPIQKIFLQYGLGRNGKGIIDSILVAMHGKDSVSTASVAQLSSQWGGAMIFDKVLNISTENNMNFVVDTSLLKSVSGNDFITIEQKYEKTFQARVSCKLIISTNEIVFKDRSRGFEERLLPIPFEYTFVDNPKGPKERKKNPNLEAELMEEIPAIFLWAYEGLKRLRAHNWQFTHSDKVDKLREEILREANPVEMFFDERIQVTEGGKIKKTDVYNSFENWAFKKRINVGGIISAQKFYAEFDRQMESKGLSSATKTIHGSQYYKDISYIS